MGEAAGTAEPHNRDGTMPTVVYALDIGVYHTGAEGQVLSKTTAAWCRATEGNRAFDSLRYSGTPCSGYFRSDREAGAAGSPGFRCGRSLPLLADSIAQDLAEGARIALGFEAPMWLPLAFREGPNLTLFSPRFPAEADHRWYLQSGAAATVKAISLGIPLLKGVMDRLPGREIRWTTEVERWKEDTLILFEAFVAGDHKVPGFKGSEDAPDEWDAFLAALAWGSIHAGFELPDGVEAESLHMAGTHPDPSVSIWDVVAGGTQGSRSTKVAGPSDCEVVGLRSAGR